MKEKFRYKESYLSYVVTFFFYYVCMAVFTSILSVYLTGIGKSNAEMSFILSASSLFGIVMIPIVGYLNDRIRKPKVIACVLIGVVAALGLLFSITRSTLALYLLDGCIMGLVTAVSPITERIAGGGRFRYGTVRVWGTVGYAISVQLCGILMQHADPSLIFVLFSASAVLSIVGFAGTSGIPYEPEEKNEKTAGQFAFVKSPAFLLFVAASFVFAGGSNITLAYCPVFLQTLGMNTGDVGTVLAISTLIELPIILFSNKFMDRFSGKTLLLADFAAMAAQFLLYGFITNAAAAVAVILLFKAVATTAFMMIRLKIVRNIVHEDFVSTAMGVEYAVNAVGAIVFQNAGGLLVEATNIHTLFFTFAGLMAVGLILTSFLKIDNSKKVFS